ncbi:MAG: hypothetical protein HYX78_11085 [Armatimonadetes bacterium]|nr:hypothetical protein [Armatimonadota bacterium]
MPKRMPNSKQIEAVDDDVAAVLKTKTTWERAEMIFDANDTMRLLIESHLRTLHPDWDDGQVSAEIARRMLYEAD